ncbi:MAG: helix-turn-helix domain-containing protein [Ardenticatenaceae bacterium]|nr:helix-turn-helix domain-containing protein [Anaerolineales bacterium]MCB8917155.1 helix-turn-helix domain-containing protein [Ardenticatenaceae bacterium]
MNRPSPNETSSADVTLSDVIRLALPFGTVVATRGGQPNKAINWVAALVDWQDLASQVQNNDLVIVPPALQARTSPAELEQNLAQLKAHNVAAVVTFGEVPAGATRVAASLALPLLLLPADSALRSVQQAIGALLLDRQAQTSDRGMQLYRQLSEMSREGKGLDAMTEMMSKLTGKIVAVQDKRLDIRAMAIPAGNRVDDKALREALIQRENLPAVLRNRKAAAKAVQAARSGQSFWQQLLPVENMGRIVSPIVSGDRARGYVSVVGPAGELDLLDTLVAEHGAAACALEMARAKAVSEAQKALRGDFLEGLLAGTLPPAEIERLERRLDHDTLQPHAVLTFGWVGDGGLSLRRLETAVNWLVSSHQRPALVHIYGGDHVCVFQALRGGDDLNVAHELDKRLREHLHSEYPGVRLYSGLAGPAMALADWPERHTQALQAMHLSERLQLLHLVEYNSLGVYQLLSQIDQLPAVQAFSKKIIGPLADYDQRQRGSLVQTIDAYFNFHGNVSQTAESLFIHRNTLLYRLERIQELTGQDLDQADMRLALQLALKVWQLRAG